MCSSAEEALGVHTAGTCQGSAGVRAAAVWSWLSLPETWRPGAERNQVQSVRCHQHRPDLASQE